MNDTTTKKIMQIVKNQWKLFSLAGAVVVMLIVTLLLPSQKSPPAISNNPGKAGSSNAIDPAPPKKTFNPFGVFTRPNSTTTPDSTGNKIEKSLTSIHSGNLSAPIPSGIVKVLPNGTRLTQAIGGESIIQTSQGIINTQANIQQGVDSNTQTESMQIIFQNPDGSTFTYIPPGTPPDEVRWGRYTNTTAKYAINYPVNWHMVYSTDLGGNELIVLYQSQTDIDDPNSHYIAFGFSDKVFNPLGTNLSESHQTAINVDGMYGALYTDGEIGSSHITSFLSYSNGNFGLIASKSDATFAYVYYYMLHSLTFNTE